MSGEQITEITRAVVEEAQCDVVGLWFVAPSLLPLSLRKPVTTKPNP